MARALKCIEQVFRACLARFKLVPVDENGRKRKTKHIKEREKRRGRRKRIIEGAGKKRMHTKSDAGLRVKEMKSFCACLA